MTVVVGTAGHIDHGKTALLRALTGIDADRLPEEKRRGLTIDVGYAHGSPDGGPELDFVDVPGHDRLVGNMLVGVGEIDAALLVVAADDGPRPQTWEHLGLLDAMGVDDGLIAITKRDLVDDERLGTVTAEVGDLLASTCLAGVAIVAVSSVSGVGLDDLRRELAMVRDRVSGRPRRPHDAAWLAIDRVFTVQGHGLVVTGSSRGRRIAAGDRLRLLPDGLDVRVRAVQVHDEATEIAASGRVALNLAGTEAGALERGHLVTDTDAIGPRAPFGSDRLFVLLRPPAALPGRLEGDTWPPRDGTEMRLHIGTAQVAARLDRSGRLAAALEGDAAMATLRLERRVATAVGERCVLRRPPPAGLLAGGVVLDADAPRGQARARLEPAVVASLVRAIEAGDDDAISDALLRLHGSRGGRISADLRLRAETSTLETVTAYEAAQPEASGLPLSQARAAAATALRMVAPGDQASSMASAEGVVAALVASGELIRDGDTVRTPDHRPARIVDLVDTPAARRLVASLDHDAPPALSQAAAEAACAEAVVRALERRGRIVVVADDLAWSATAFERLSRSALALADEAPLTPARLRDATGTSRKYVMALLEDLDRRGILRRTPEGHVRGPRAEERR